MEVPRSSTRLQRGWHFSRRLNMKKSLLLLASLLFAQFTVSAQAADYDKSGMGMDKMSGHDMMMGGKMMGMHKMTGTVDKLDHAKGTLALKTGVGDLVLHFPPPAVKDLKDGDTITVELSFSKDSGMKK
jgi:hypothetical protein